MASLHISNSEPVFQAVVDGVEFQNQLDVTLLFEFAGMGILPPFGSADTASLRAPFLFNALLTDARTLGPDGKFPQHQFLGRGTAELHYTKDTSFIDPPVSWLFTHGRYDFEDAAPIPEPGTLMLTGIGLAGLAVRKVRARRGTGRSPHR